MKDLHREIIVSSLICLLICGSVLSKSTDASHNRKPGFMPSSEQSSGPNSLSVGENKKSDSKQVTVTVTTPPTSSLTPEVMRQEYDVNGMSMVLMLAMIGVAVGTMCAVGTLVVIYMIRRRALATKEVTRTLAQRTNMYIIKNENYDLNKTLAGIPSVTDMWKEMHIES